MKKTLKTPGSTLILILVILALSIGVYSQEDKTISPQAKAYLQEFFDIIQKNSLRTKEVDWETLRRQTFEKAAGAKEPVDTFEAIRFALSGLGDKHSFLQLSEELIEKEKARRQTETNEVVKTNRITSPFIKRSEPEGFLHKAGNCVVPRVIVPFEQFEEIEVMNAYAAALHKFIVESDTKNPCGWIIDLRGNDGGAVFPMLAGVSALLDEGDLVNAVAPDGKKISFFYRDGQSGVRQLDGKETILTKIEVPYRVKKQLPIAVLIDRDTASSGEITAIAFLGRANTRFFGEHTYGASSANRSFKLSDGANVVLSVAVDVDRNGKAYPEGIEPDEKIVLTGDKAPLAKEDPVIHAALGWIEEQ